MSKRERSRCRSKVDGNVERLYKHHLNPPIYKRRAWDLPRADTDVPSDLAIDRIKPLNNTVPYYNQHIIISTGKSDWESRIENETEGANMAKALKEMTKRTPGLDDPTPVTMISNSSFPIRQHQGTLDEPSSDCLSGSIYLFPQFLFFPRILNTEAHHNRLVHTYLSPRQDRESATASPPEFAEPQPITKPTILICSHASRDRRCGILGPLLHREFETCAQKEELNIDAAMISHVGGHAFAGNVIVYIPPNYPVELNKSMGGKDITSPLAGMGIWYGRVEPKHVQGILDVTVRKGSIIGELWRGTSESQLKG
ncbi:MAG: hypothetical protein LQ349_006037 [Xanthoria aureola]|nr:MAG: hypothetical protein LQ349_006037 [Xanthoria aureola]